MNKISKTKATSIRIIVLILKVLFLHISLTVLDLGRKGHASSLYKLAAWKTKTTEFIKRNITKSRNLIKNLRKVKMKILNKTDKNKNNYLLVLPCKISMSRTHKQCSNPGSHRFWPFNVSRMETFLRNKEVSTIRPTQARPSLPKRSNINQS